MSQPWLFYYRRRLRAISQPAFRENPLPAREYAYRVIAMIGDGEPTAALRKGQTIRTGQAPVFQLERRFQVEATWRVRAPAVERNGATCEVTRCQVIIVRRHEGNAVREIQFCRWSANLKKGIGTIGFVCSILFIDGNRSAALCHRELLVLPRQRERNIVRVAESGSRPVYAPIRCILEQAALLSSKQKNGVGICRGNGD